MYDKMLEEDIRDYRKNIANTIYIQPYSNDIKKLLKCRTKDKLYFLKYMITNNIIQKELYDELYERVKTDYNTAYKCIIGLISVNEL